MDNTKHDGALDLTALPLLTMRRVCLLADCHRSTVRRSPLVPVGKRGRTVVYKTSDVLAWMSGQLASNDESAAPRRARDAQPAEDAVTRLRRIAREGHGQ